MKQTLNWKSREVVNIYDEVSLWSAPFGRLLLENIPMMPAAQVVDIGFGTGFPLIELSQRFGDKSNIYGIDIWEEGIHRTKTRIATLEINNIEILEESAASIRIGDNQIDLVTSSLGVNNFDQRGDVYLEIHRILKKGGRLCLTTNPVGTFEELFEVFDSVFQEMGMEEEQSRLEEYIQHRNTEKGIISELEQYGFEVLKIKRDTTNMRFADARAILNHSLMRIGFRESWERMVREDKREEFFERLTQKIDDIVESKGEFLMTIPMLYLEFGK